jgi:hypothetical protein
MLVDAVEAMDRGNSAVKQTASWIGREMAVAAEQVTARTWMPLADVHRRTSDVLGVVAGAGAAMRVLDPTPAEYARRARRMVDAAAKVILDPGYSDKAERLGYATRRAERKDRAFSAQEEGARLAGTAPSPRLGPSSSRTGCESSLLGTVTSGRRRTRASGSAFRVPAKSPSTNQTSGLQS